MNFNTEPVVIVAAIEAVLALAVGFGLDITAEQLGLITAAVTAVLALIVRSKVTPTTEVAAIDPEHLP